MFAAWSSFYSLLGEASASLIGLLFVVSTLSAQLDRNLARNGTGLFLTPTVFKLASVLALSAIALAPGLPDWVLRALAGLVALVGVLNLVGVSLGLFRRDGLGAPLHWSDPWCYGAAPALVFLGLGVSQALPDPAAARGTGIAAAALLLLGVRNAWDLVTALAERVRESRAG